MSNIQVVVRCRGRNEREINAKSQVVIELPSETYSIANPTITINQNQGNQLSQQIANSNDTKTYNYDQVYGPLADQEIVYNRVVLPLFNDFLNGFNVTVLAYGQTGTGKTYTMSGKEVGSPKGSKCEKNGSIHGNGVINETSGIIPRVLNELFQSLQDTDHDYLIKCSFIELYNETLKDLLNDENDVNKQGLKIFENKKQANSILIQNLKEININDLSSGFSLLQKGLQKRKIASTKLNDVSSRSHTIFTINLYKKSNDNDDLIRFSKINLVDLAGLENINKSGSINQRAKEAGSINQSLLTLGRVINSLSDKSLNSHTNPNHIPYRESKLTRLLQDSIGGKTKTLLISTISPAKINLEETNSTLEYSLKVKSIENKPQLGQDFNLIMKKILIKDLSNEIIKLNNDLISTRNRNGIWMNEINYNNLLEENSSYKNEINELKMKIKNLQLKFQRQEETIRVTESSKNELQQEVDTLTQLNDKVMTTMKSSNHTIINALEATGNLINHINGISQNSKELHSLHELITKNLNLMKVNFNGNFNKINNEINNSILNEIPSYLEKLIKDLNNNEELDQFKFVQNDNFKKLNKLNDDLNIYLTKEFMKTNNLQHSIDHFVETSVIEKINEFKQSFRNNFDRVINQEYLNVERLMKSSLNDFTHELVDSEKAKLGEKTSNWNNKFNTVEDNMKSSFDHYQENINKVTNNNQDKLQKTSLELSNTINSSIKTNFSHLNQSFVDDEDKIIKILPDVNSITTNFGDHLNRSNNTINQISSNLNSIVTQRSPLKERSSLSNNTNHTANISTADSKKVSPKKSLIPTLNNKENDPKRRRIE